MPVTSRVDVTSGKAPFSAEIFSVLSHQPYATGCYRVLQGPARIPRQKMPTGSTRPFEVGNQVLISSHRKLLSSKAMAVGLISSHRKLLSSKAMAVERCGKVGFLSAARCDEDAAQRGIGMDVIGIAGKGKRRIQDGRRRGAGAREPRQQ
jgi:hypothetical protein